MAKVITYKTPVKVTRDEFGQISLLVDPTKAVRGNIKEIELKDGDAILKFTKVISDHNTMEMNIAKSILSVGQDEAESFLDIQKIEE